MREFLISPNRFAFNGMEQDDEMHDAPGSSYDFGARLYDPRVARWLSVDPLAYIYPSWSPYTMALNNPILYFDTDGQSVGKGTKVINNSNVTIRITGDGFIKRQQLDGTMTKIMGNAWDSKTNTFNPDSDIRGFIELPPGSVFEPISYTLKSIDECGNAFYDEVTGGKVTLTDGREYFVPLHDVDFIDLQDNQAATVVDGGIAWFDAQVTIDSPRNTPKDKEAHGGQIAVGDGGAVTISGNSASNLTIEGSGVGVNQVRTGKPDGAGKTIKGGTGDDNPFKLDNSQYRATEIKD